ncbi:unnamed protein product [Ectocarpus sp. 4 AP-2014]
MHLHTANCCVCSWRTKRRTSARDYRTFGNVKTCCDLGSPTALARQQRVCSIDTPLVPNQLEAAQPKSESKRYRCCPHFEDTQRHVIPKMEQTKFAASDLCRCAAEDCAYLDQLQRKI